MSKSITEFDEFTGRFEAVERVEVRPRVSGYIWPTKFEQGHEVKKGDILFVIDPRPYEATLKRAQAELARAHAARARRVRARPRRKAGRKRAISQEEFDARISGSEQADANVQAAEAAVESAALDLTFTEVRAPISGLVGRAEITAGNLVAAGQTLLTTSCPSIPSTSRSKATSRCISSTSTWRCAASARARATRESGVGRARR